jgi:DHA1 family tetracycline resistance protein-like MFS transporter
MTYVFYFFTKPSAPVYLPGAPYYIAAILMAVSALLAISNFRKTTADTIKPAES